MIERLKKLRTTIEVQAEMCLSLIDAALAELEAGSEDASVACPDCGEKDKLDNTTVMGEDSRLTCLSCGISFAGELVREEA